MSKNSENAVSALIIPQGVVNQYKSEVLLEDQHERETKDKEEKFITIKIAKTKSLIYLNPDKNSREGSPVKLEKPQIETTEDKYRSDREEEETEDADTAHFTETFKDIKLDSGLTSIAPSVLEKVKSQRQSIKRSQLRAPTQHDECCAKCLVY